ARNAAQRATLLRHATALHRACEDALTGESDRATLRDAYRAVVERLEGPPPPPAADPRGNGGPRQR
ncbi:MAG TPA: hypothetical protein VFG47_18765, partial [Geminicoccaceae bacterium]|nr:hypothetical protein [Geminicoccaceae bacterium]